MALGRVEPAAPSRSPPTASPAGAISAGWASSRRPPNSRRRPSRRRNCGPVWVYRTRVVVERAGGGRCARGMPVTLEIPLAETDGPTLCRRRRGGVPRSRTAARARGRRNRGGPPDRTGKEREKREDGFADGDAVVLDDVVMRYGKGSPALGPAFQARLPRGRITGLVGPDGAGKVHADAPDRRSDRRAPGDGQPCSAASCRREGGGGPRPARLHAPGRRALHRPDGGRET